MSLSKQRQVFVGYYTAGDTAFNGTQSAIKAGYAESGARATASRLLQIPEIKDAVDARILSEQETLLRISDVARGRITDLLDESLAMDPDKVRRDGRLIKKIKIQGIGKKVVERVKGSEDVNDAGEETVLEIHKEPYQIELELYDGLKALELMGRHHKLFTDKVEAELEVKEFSFDIGSNTREEASE